LATAGKWLLLLLLVVGLPLTAMAQGGSGRITGVVTDTTGGVLPGVTVNARGPAAVMKTTVTDSAGKYNFESLAPGAWTLTFQLAGFATQTSAVTVAAGQAATVEAKLAVGAQTEAVQVTGTLIPRPTLEAMSPVTTLEVEELTYRGINRVEDLLTSLPQVFVAQNSSVSNGASGTATVDLRYLGTQRTLVLIDGKRMPQGDAFSTGADLNFIPSALVKRVDVLTGGASSTYGADAVAGVVNFVLDRDFTGFKGGVEYSGYQHNNSNSLADSINAAKGFSIIKGNRWNDGPIDFNVAFGSKFADNRGHASFYLDYRKTNAITKDQRDYTNCSVATLYSTPTCGGSSTIPAGRFIDPSGASWVLDTNPTTDPTGDQLRPRTSADVYNYAPKNFMQRPDQRWAGGAFINLDMNKYITVYGDVMFMDDTTDAQIAESGDFANTSQIDCRSPLLSAQEYQTLCANFGYNNTDNYLSPVIIMRRNVEGGGRVSHLNHTDLRYTAGAKGTLNNVWSYDTYGLQATVRSPQSYSNDLNYVRMQNALNIGPDGQCTADTENGCVPWNVFKVGGVTQQALNYLSLDEVLDSGTRTRVFNFTLKGDLKDYGVVSPWATEAVKVATGYEYRQEYLFVRSDFAYENALGAGSGGPTLSVDGTYSVNEFFAEGLIPIVQDKPYAKDLSLEAGIRESNYSSTGTHATYKLQASWAPVPDFKFRFGYNRATRSPNITELYTPQGLGLGGSSDPCAGPTPGYSQAQCALTGVPASMYGHVLDNPAGQYNTLSGGNPNLQPEVADTWTAGAVLTPRKFLPGFTATLDYYDVKIKETIGSLGSNDILNTCATTGQLCNLIHRDSYYTTWLTTQGYVITANANVGQLRSQGLDVTGSYTRPVPHDLGAFSINFIGTYLIKEYVNTGLYDYDCVGLFGNTCGVPTPKWRHLSRFSWETPWKVTITAGWRFIGPVMEDSGSSQVALSNPARFATLEGVGNMAANIPSFNWLDLGVTWKITKNITFIGGVNNVFDTEPAMGFGSSPNDYGTGFYGMYDALGRYIHTGVQFTF
jgi:outer membrane receptor protein involved in Fe transport